MINRFSQVFPLAVVALAFAGLTAGAQETNGVQATASVAVTATPVEARSTAAAPAVQLSSGVADVLKLSQAHVGESTVVAYIQSSDRGYGALSASEIAYLHDEGVSDVVVKAMLDKRKSLADANAQYAQTQQPTQAATPPSVWQTAPTSTAQSGQVTAPASTTYVQPAPSSSVSVYYVPNTPMFPGHPDYYSYPYYYGPSYGYGYYGYGYRGYYGPTIGLSFGFGGRWGGGHWGHHR